MFLLTSLKNEYHNLISKSNLYSGKVYILDDDTLVIDEFSYDGNGFGVYINVATRGRNLKSYAKNRIDVPYPSGTEVIIVPIVHRFIVLVLSMNDNQHQLVCF